MTMTMFNSLQAEYKVPFGAAKTGECHRFTFCLAPQDARTPVWELYRAGENQPLLVWPMTPLGEGRFTCEYTPDTAGLYYYRFTLSDGTVLHREADGSAAFGEGERWQLTVCRADYDVPQRFGGKTMLQIFPDRFYNSGKPKTGVPADRILHADWGEEPISRPDADGEFRCNDYFGGDLAGITQKLDYIASMGIEVIYLNPIFEAHSNHRYNTADYFKIDPLLGDEQDFMTLCEEAHRRGILIVLDGVFNHTGSDSIYFNREKRYGGGGAYHDENSPYRDWFFFGEGNKYESWWGFETLPKVNSQNPAWREYLCGENGILRHWLRLGADGWRLDVVDEYPDEMVRAIRSAVRAEKPDAILIGEVWEDASCKQAYGEQRMYLMGEELDSVMNYPLRRAILEYLREGDAPRFGNTVMTLFEHYPRPTWDVMMNLLSSHDAPRAITELGALPQGEHDRDWQREHNTLSVAQYYRGRQRLMMGTMICMGLPGCPCLYYGDEAGLSGYSDPFNRGTYPWGSEDIGLRECIRQLSLLRKKHPALAHGDIRPLHCEGTMAAWRRHAEGETITCCVNAGDAPVPLPQDVRGELLFVVGHLRDGALAPQSAIWFKQEG